MIALLFKIYKYINNCSDSFVMLNKWFKYFIKINEHIRELKMVIGKSKDVRDR